MLKQIFEPYFKTLHASSFGGQNNTVSVLQADTHTQGAASMLACSHQADIRKEFASLAPAEVCVKLLTTLMHVGCQLFIHKPDSSCLNKFLSACRTRYKKFPYFTHSDFWKKNFSNFPNMFSDW